MEFFTWFHFILRISRNHFILLVCGFMNLLFYFWWALQFLVFRIIDFRNVINLLFNNFKWISNLLYFMRLFIRFLLNYFDFLLSLDFSLFLLLNFSLMLYLLQVYEIIFLFNNFIHLLLFLLIHKIALITNFFDSLIKFYMLWFPITFLLFKEFIFLIHFLLFLWWRHKVSWFNRTSWIITKINLSLIFNLKLASCPTK